MYNLLTGIVTKNIPNDFIGFINRSPYEKVKKEFKKLQLLYSNIDLDTVKDHPFIYVTNIENTKYTPENYETTIINATDSINLEYKYNHESLPFKESILQIKTFNEEQHKTINFNDVDENKNNELVNSSTFNDFSSALLKSEIILEKDQRLESSKKSANKLARANGCSIINNKSIINEYVSKLDYPASVEGSFDEKHLCIDKSILHTVLMENFKVLPMELENGNSSNFFVYAKNKNSEDSRVLCAETNNESEEINNLITKKSDRKLEDFAEDLKNVTYTNNYGNFYDKTQRLIEISPELCKILPVSEETVNSVNRISFLCKADKVIETVKKCLYLHGLIGRLCAKSDGEEKTVYDGVYEHIRPRFVSESIPNSIAAKVVAVSDKMEYVMSYIIPSSDENFRYNYKLRKTITSVISITLKSELDFNSGDFIAKILYVSLQDKGIVDYEYFKKSIKEIIPDVYRDECIESGYDFSEIDAINYVNLNISKLNRLLTNLYEINSKYNGKLILQIQKMLEVNCNKYKYTPMKLDSNNSCDMFERLSKCSEEDLVFYKLILRGVFNKLN